MCEAYLSKFLSFSILLYQCEAGNFILSEVVSDRLYYMIFH
jgi:hypothetical protein